MSPLINIPGCSISLQFVCMAGKLNTDLKWQAKLNFLIDDSRPKGRNLINCDKVAGHGGAMPSHFVTI